MRTERQKIHDNAMLRASKILRRFGYSVERMPDSGCNFDLLADRSIRIEVKAANRQVSDSSPHGFWSVNVHRHNILNLKGVHVFWIQLRNFPGIEKGFHLIIPVRKLGYKKTIHITYRTFFRYWVTWLRRYDLVGKKGISGSPKWRPKRNLPEFRIGKNHGMYRNMLGISNMAKRPLSVVMRWRRRDPSFPRVADKQYGMEVFELPTVVRYLVEKIKS